MLSMELKKLLRAWVLAICLAFSIGTNITLFRAMENVASDYEDYRKRNEELPPGVQLPPLSGTDTTGKAFTIGYGQPDQRTLLVAFTQNCPFCRQNWPTWTRLIQQAKSHQVRIVAVNVGASLGAEYIQANGLSDIPLFATIDYATRAAYKIPAVPATMLINANGTLAETWIGVLDAAEEEKLQRTLQQSER
jgi:hypothetical protein